MLMAITHSQRGSPMDRIPKLSPQTYAQVKADMPAHRHPDTHPSTKPNQVSATVLPAKPLISKLTTTAAA